MTKRAAFEPEIITLLRDAARMLAYPDVATADEWNGVLERIDAIGDEWEREENLENLKISLGLHRKQEEGKPRRMETARHETGVALAKRWWPNGWVDELARMEFERDDSTLRRLAAAGKSTAQEIGTAFDGGMRALADITPGFEALVEQQRRDLVLRYLQGPAHEWARDIRSTRSSFARGFERLKMVTGGK
jgi:hypothetical protein